MSVRSARPLGRVLFIILSSLLLAGCPAPPKAPSRVTPLETGFRRASEPAAAPGTQPVNLPAEPALAMPQDRHDPVLPHEELQLPAGSLPLDAWSSLCGFNEIRVVPNATPYTVELQGPEGVLSLVLGHRFAKWNGMNVGLGFAPALRAGRLTLHSVDVLKNAYPLAVGAFTIPKAARVLVLDPGHGGPDPGSVYSGKRIYEKDLTLDWALRIEKLLQDSSWRVILTRREDRELSLMERVAIADTHQGDVFISLHFNSLEPTGPAREESGIETYCLTPVGAPSNINRNFEDDPKRVYPNNEFDAENILLAMRLQSSLVKSTARRDRGVRRARFMTVIREQRRPAVLVEGGFLSNPAEASLILDPSYRQQMAQAVCDALPN